MADSPDIFQENYRAYCARIAETDLRSIQDRLGLVSDGDRTFLPFFHTRYLVSKSGIVDEDGNRPDYMVSVILAKYILLCPARLHIDAEWVAFKDFKSVSPCTNVNFFSSDTEKAIEKTFSGKLDDLSAACEAFGGFHHPLSIPYDLSRRFDALPRISLLLLFNDGDDEFPAQCTILFQRQAEFYLDPESLAMSGAFLVRNLRMHCSESREPRNR